MGQLVLHRDISPVVQPQYLAVVDRLIHLVPLPVLEPISGCGESHNDHEWESADNRFHGLEGFDALKDDDDEEKEVGDTAELVVEVLGDEGEDGVLGGNDLVADEACSSRCRLWRSCFDNEEGALLVGMASRLT